MTPNGKLKAAIFDSGKTQAEIADQVGVHESLMSKFVRGRRRPSPDQQKSIARALKVQPREIFGEVAK